VVFLLNKGQREQTLGSWRNEMILQLFEGEKIRFAAFDAEKDPEVFSKWTNDPEYLRKLDSEPARPLAPFHIKKKFEEMEKEAHRDFYYFVIRTKQDDRAIGFVHIRWIEWNHGNAHFNMGIGSREDRRKGYGSEALQMLMRYAFEELNLYRLTVQTMEYNTAAQKFLEKHGWQCEVRRREAIYRDGRYWDALTYGLLAEEWAQAAGERQAK
jgi:RimJ/RimL family protein N-acetyltransferase